MGIQINGQTDRITAIDGTIDFVSNIGNIGLITASNYVLQDSITIGAGSTVIKASNGKLGIGTDNPLTTLHVRGTTHALGHGEAALVWGNTSSLGTLSYSGSDAVVTAANNLKINVNGSERASIKSTGQVAIGTVTAETNFLTTINGDLSLGEKSGTDNTFIDQKQDGDLHLINSGRTANGASNTPGAGGVGINRYNNIAGGTSLFRDFTVYNGKGSKVLSVDGSAAAVGIGTDSPDQTLEVFKQSGTNLVKVTSQANSTIGIELEKTGATTQSWRIADGQTVNGMFQIYDVTDSKTPFNIDTGQRVLLGSTSNRFYAAKLQVQGASDSNYILMHNTTAGDGDGNRYSKFIYSGTQSGGETSDLAHINAAHDGTADDQKGRLEFRVNTGSGNHSPTEALRIDSGGHVLIGTASKSSQIYADQLTLANSGTHCGMTIRSATGGIGSIYFSDGTSGNNEYRGFVEYHHTTSGVSDYFKIGTASNESLRITNAGGVISKASLFNNYQHLVCQGGSGGDGIKNYILVCKTNTTDVRLSGHFVITRQAGASGIAISKIEANIISNNSAGDFRYQTRSFSTRGSYPGMEGRWVTLTYGGNNYYAIRLDPATDSSRWASQPQHCYFTGTENNCVGNGLGTIIDDNANTISSVTELDDIQGSTVVRNSYNYIKEGYLSVQGGDGQQACIIQPYELNVSTGSQPIPLTVKSQKNTVLEVNRMYTQGILIQFRQNNDARGYINNSGTTTSLVQSGSDERLKKNFEDWTEEVLPYFKALKPKKFNFKEESDDTKKTKGYIAQDNLEAFPEAYPLNPNDDRYWFANSEMVPYLMKALQEEIIKREAIEEKYNALESRISALESA